MQLKLIMSKCVTFTASSPSTQLYNDGNDDIAKMNRFAFPSISFSPSFPLNMSPNLPRPGAALLAPSSPASASNVLSPRSAHRGGISCSAHSGMATSPHSNPKQLPSYFSPATSEESSGLLSAWSLESPLPPLSPRGQKLADSEKYHNAKCLNRIVEKRRKASDGTEDIMVNEWVKHVLEDGSHPCTNIFSIEFCPRPQHMYERSLSMFPLPRNS